MKPFLSLMILGLFLAVAGFAVLFVALVFLLAKLALNSTYLLP
jgi:hypothetical protein